MKNFRSYLFLAVLVSAGTVSAGCVVRGGAAFRTSSPGYDAQLVEVSPGIWVVEDYDDPVFYNDGFYWRYYGGTWYRSHSHTSGWVHISNHQVPHAVIRIDRPGRYSHYRAHGNARVRPIGRSNERVPARSRHHDSRRTQPTVRDHRQPARSPAVRDHRQPASSPAVRDHRQPAPAARDHRQEQKAKKGDKPKGRDHRRP